MIWVECTGVRDSVFIVVHAEGVDYALAALGYDEHAVNRIVLGKFVWETDSVRNFRTVCATAAPEAFAVTT